MSTKRWMRVFLLVAALTVVAGITTVVVGAQRPTSFGWFAYAPLSGDSFSPDGVTLVQTTVITGAIICAAGCVALGFWAGWAVGSRRASRLS